MMRVGFAGLGRMGALMARNLHEAGFALTLWNRTMPTAQELAAELSCDFAQTPAELADRSDVVITMLADDAASEIVHLGKEGLFSAMNAPIFIEMGTMSAAHIERLAATAPKGALVIDAPVSGATAAAEAGALLIMAGASAETLAPFEPIFTAIGRKVMPFGTLGRASVMKLAINSMIHGINQNFAEAMNVARSAGINDIAAFDVIEESAACPPMLKYRRPQYLDEGSSPVSFTVDLALKDMREFEALAARVGQAIPQSNVTTELLLAAQEAGFGARDMAAMLEFMREKGE